VAFAYLRRLTAESATFDKTGEANVITAALLEISFSAIPLSELIFLLYVFLSSFMNLILLLSYAILTQERISIM
jgi:hypothetical protein